DCGETFGPPSWYGRGGVTIAIAAAADPALAGVYDVRSSRPPSNAFTVRPSLLDGDTRHDRLRADGPRDRGGSRTLLADGLARGAATLRDSPHALARRRALPRRTAGLRRLRRPLRARRARDASPDRANQASRGRRSVSPG